MAFNNWWLKHVNAATDLMIREQPDGLYHDLADEASVGIVTIRSAELTDSETSMTAANDLAVRRALEAAGVEFIRPERRRSR